MVSYHYPKEYPDDIHEICPRLFMSDVFTAEKPNVLAELKITHIVTVSSGIAPRYPDKFVYKVIPVEDQPMQDLKQHFERAIEFIEEALSKEEGVVLVHCTAGISRSGTIVCAYLMWKNKWTFDQAWEYGRSKRDKMYPNVGF